MSKVKCEVVRDLMPLVADDVASAESKQLVQEHVKNCETCKAYYDGMTAKIERSADPEPDTNFITFCKKMEKRFTLKRVLILLLALVIALIPIGGIAMFIEHKLYSWVDMPIDRMTVTAYKDENNDIWFGIDMKDGYGWYYIYCWDRVDNVFYFTPQMHEWTLGEKGNTADETIYTGVNLSIVDGQLCYIESEWDTVYDEEAHAYVDKWTGHAIPIKAARLGTYDNFITICTEDDVNDLPLMKLATIDAENAENEHVRPDLSPELIND